MRPNRQWIRRLGCIPALALALQVPMVRAEMIGAERLIEAPAPNDAEQDRAKVQHFLDRANVKERLQALGVDALNARDRVSSLSDAEVHALAQRIDSMPAGGALSQYDLILILLIVILVAVLV